MARLTPRQQEYIWLAGSFPDRVVRQGRGYRTKKLQYSLDEEGVIYIFGYGTPLLWLENGGLFRKLQDNMSFYLSDSGEQEFNKLLMKGGLSSSRLREARLKPRKEV